MHISGKIAAFLIIVLGGTAFVMSTQLLDFQSSWLKQVNGKYADLTKARDSTAKAKKELAALQAELDRVMLGWDSYANNRNTSGDPATGTLNIDIGPKFVEEKKDKDGKPVMPVIYAFQPSADGKVFEYVGEFRAERIAAANSTFKANWKMRPQDAAMWRLGPNWRIRTRIPTGEKLKFDEMALLFNDVDERLAYNTHELQRSRDEFSKKIKQALANRESDLQGFQSLQGERGKIDDEMIDGVLLTMVKEEEARNAALAAGSKLRHELHDIVEEFERAKAANSKAAAAMPQGEPTAPKTAGR